MNKNEMRILAKQIATEFISKGNKYLFYTSLLEQIDNVEKLTQFHNVPDKLVKQVCNLAWDNIVDNIVDKL